VVMAEPKARPSSSAAPAGEHTQDVPDRDDPHGLDGATQEPHGDDDEDLQLTQPLPSAAAPRAHGHATTTARVPTLRARGSGPAGMVIPLRPGLVIGRNGDPGAVLVDRARAADAQLVSGKHATIINKNGKWFIRDTDSKWGTTVNSDRIAPREDMEIKEEDVVNFGDDGTGAYTRFEFAVEGVGERADEEYLRTIKHLLFDANSRIARSTVADIAAVEAEVGRFINALRAAYDKLRNKRAQVVGKRAQRQWAQRDGHRKAARRDCKRPRGHG
jgi:hypothetical protein